MYYDDNQTVPKHEPTQTVQYPPMCELPSARKPRWRSGASIPCAILVRSSLPCLFCIFLFCVQVLYFLVIRVPPDSLQHVVFCILPPPYHVCRACVHHFLYQMCAFCTRIASLCPGSRDLHHHATLPTIFWLAHLFCVCLFPSLLPHSFTWVQLQWISMSQPMFSGAGCLVSYPPTMCIITCAPFPGVQYPVSVFWLWAEILWLSCISSHLMVAASRNLRKTAGHTNKNKYKYIQCGAKNGLGVISR